MALEGSLCDSEDLRLELPKAIGLGDVDWPTPPLLGWFFTHQLWLRFIIAMVGVCFAVGGLWALCGYSGTAEPNTVDCRASTVLVLHRRGHDLSLVHRSEEEGQQGGADHDRGGPGDGLGSDLHVESVGVGDHQRVEAGRHCGKEPVGGR